MAASLVAASLVAASHIAARGERKGARPGQFSVQIDSRIFLYCSVV